MQEYLFVYGTLLKTFNHEARQSVLPNLRFIGEAYTTGRLYNLGGYPALVEQNGFRVKGELYELLEVERVLTELDEYEGPEYERRFKTVETFNSITVKSWVYVYKEHPGEQHKEIMNGDYAAFIRNRGL